MLNLPMPSDLIYELTILRSPPDIDLIIKSLSTLAEFASAFISVYIHSKISLTRKVDPSPRYHRRATSLSSQYATGEFSRRDDVWWCERCPHHQTSLPIDPCPRRCPVLGSLPNITATTPTQSPPYCRVLEWNFVSECRLRCVGAVSGHSQLKSK